MNACTTWASNDGDAAHHDHHQALADALIEGDHHLARDIMAEAVQASRKRVMEALVTTETPTYPAAACQRYRSMNELAQTHGGLFVEMDRVPTRFSRFISWLRAELGV